MRELGNAIEGALLIGCLFGLLAIVLGVAVAELCRGWRIWRAKRHVVAMSVAAIAAAIVAQKTPTAMVAWDSYFTDTAYEINTNNYQQITFTWGVALGTPPNAEATFSAIDIHTYNIDATDRLFTIATVPMSDGTLTAIMETDATNYAYWAECSYIPDAPVVTNGVYHLQCIGGTNVWIPVGITIHDNGRCISPPEGE